MLLLSKLQKEKTKVEKDMDHKVSISQKEIEFLESKLERMPEEKQDVTGTDTEVLNNELLEYLKSVLKE